MTVPAPVPFDNQSCWPFVPSSARKNKVPLTLISKAGIELPVPGLMSLTMTVPPELPSDRHSSYPSVESLASKKSVPPTLVHQLSSICGPVAFPKLPAVGDVIRRKEERSIDVRQRLGV